MKNIYLLFSGQGSQYVGMAANEDHHYLDVASELLQVNIKEMCLQGPLEELTETQFTQPAIVAHSYILTKKILTLIHQKGWHLKAVLGHSVGEYSALVAAGSLDFSQAIQLVHARGKFMQESTQESGTMFAILKCPAQYIEQECQLISGVVAAANYNEPEQTVISGEREACLQLIAQLKEKYSSVRSIPLKVSAAFHSPLMMPAQEKMKQLINQCHMEPLKIPYFANINAQLYDIGTAIDVIKNNLVEQISGSVRWLQSAQQIPQEAVAIEVGPGKVLKNLMKKINPELAVYAMDDNLDWQALQEL